MRRWSSAAGFPVPAEGLAPSLGVGEVAWMAAFLVSCQLPLAAYGAGLLPAAAYGSAWRLGVRRTLCAGAAGAMLCRGRLPTAAAFRDWRLWLWLGLVSFLDTPPVSFAARLADPLSVLAMAQRSPLFFAVARQWQLGRSITEGCRGWVLSK